MPEQIIQSRIIPRKAPSGILLRGRLNNYLFEDLRSNFIIISSPAGYGKTTFVQNFFESYKIKYGWMYCSADINNFDIFLNYFVHSIKILNSAFGGKIIESLNSLAGTQELKKDFQSIIPALVGSFCNDFINMFKEDVYVVLDDLHNLGNSDWLTLLLNTLIEYIPENLHIVITTRQVPEFNISKLAAKRNVVQITKDDLRFSKDETQQLINNVYSLNPLDNEMDLLEDKMDGWITGIHLILQSQGNSLASILDQKSELPDNLFNYFANDIFINLDAEIQNFLLETCYMDSFNIEICEEVLNLKNSKGIINELLKRSLFVETYLDDENGRFYNYHSLFKSFLNTKAEETKNKNEVYSTLEKIADYYNNRNDILSAVNFYLQAKKYDKASEIIKNVFNELFNSGQYETLWQYIVRLPNEKISSDNLLLIIKAKLLKVYLDSTEESLKIAEDLLMNNELEENVKFESVLFLSEILREKGKSEEALKLLLQIRDSISNPEHKVIYAYYLGNILFHRGPNAYDEIIEVLNEAVITARDNDIKTFTADIQMLLGIIYQDRGDFIKSLFYYEHASKNVKNIFREFQIITNIIQLYSSSGNFEKAYENTVKAEEIYNKFPLISLKRFLLRTLSMFRFECGDYESSIKYFEEIIEFDIGHNNLSFLFWYYLFLGEIYIFLCKQERSMEYYELAEKYLDKEDEHEKLELSLHRSILDKNNSITGKTEKNIVNAYNYFNKNNYIYSRVQVELHLADLYYKNGSFNSCLKYISSCLNICNERKYISFLEQHFLIYRHLFDFASESGVNKEFINEIQVNLLDRKNFSWLSDKYMQRLSYEIENLYDISLITFGGPEIKIRGVEISESKWQRKKSKLILIFLLLNPGKRFSKDKMIDMFFEDMSIDSAENLFHQAITNIRNAVCVEYKLATGEKNISKKKSKADKNINEPSSPSFIVYEDKILKLSDKYNYISDAIEFNKIYNKIKSPETEINDVIKLCKQIVKLYKGEFMSGYYSSWIEELRESYISKFTDICRKLIEIYKSKDLHSDVIEYSELLLKHDKLNESSYIDLIEAYAKMENINMAKSKLSTMLKVYNDEFGEKPSKTVLDKIQNIFILNEPIS